MTASLFGMTLKLKLYIRERRKGRTRDCRWNKIMGSSRIRNSFYSLRGKLVQSYSEYLSDNGFSTSLYIMTWHVICVQFVNLVYNPNKSNPLDLWKDNMIMWKSIHVRHVRYYFIEKVTKYFMWLTFMWLGIMTYVYRIMSYKLHFYYFNTR